MLAFQVPRGPTLTFRISSYTLLKDVISLIKRPTGFKKTHESAPLLIMNGFDESLPHHKLLTTTFQNMLPAVNVKKVQLNTLKRCLLFNCTADNTIDVRHYSISATPVGVNKAIKKLLKKVPDLSKYADISDFLTNGYFSESDGEDGPDSQVVLPQKLAGRGNLKSNRSAIRLTELGPRVSLQLVKIQDGVGEGEVLYHSYIKKTAEEKKKLRIKIEKQKQLKEKRRKEQQKNVEQKKKAIKNTRKRRIEEDVSSDDDVQHFKDEVGHAPDDELLLKTKRTKRSSSFKKLQDESAPMEEKSDEIISHQDISLSKMDSEEPSQLKSKRTKRSESFKKSKIEGSSKNVTETELTLNDKTAITHVKSENVKGIAFRKKKI